MEKVGNYYFIATNRDELKILFINIGNCQVEFDNTFGDVDESGILGYNATDKKFNPCINNTNNTIHIFLIYDCLNKDSYEDEISYTKAFIDEHKNNCYLLRHGKTSENITSMFNNQNIWEGSHINSPEYVYPEILQIFINGEDVENKIDEYFMSLND